jgi:uncharacterized protein (TIGR02001 family)
MPTLFSPIIFIFIFFLPPSYSFAQNEVNDKTPFEFSSNITLATDYHFRGTTQTDQRPAVQVEVEGVYKNNFYAGIWTSNVDLADGDNVDFEVDYYVGYRKELGQYSADVSLAYYSYPGALESLNYEYFESFFILKRNSQYFNLEGTVAYAPDSFGSSGDAYYLMAALEVPLLESGFTLLSHFGRQYADDETLFGFPDYNDWSIGLEKNIWGFALNLSYIDTNLTDSECSNGCDARAVFSISWDYP